MQQAQLDISGPGEAERLAAMAEEESQARAELAALEGRIVAIQAEQARAMAARDMGAIRALMTVRTGMLAHSYASFNGGCAQLLFVLARHGRSATRLAREEPSWRPYSALVTPTPTTMCEEVNLCILEQ